MNKTNRWVAVARLGFLAAGAWFIWRGLDGRGDDLRDGLSATPPLGFALSLILVCAGLLCTGLLWRAILASLGYELAAVPALAVFFFGQLGKYIPGSVWSFGVQANGARRHGVPVSTTLRASLIFLGFHVATGAVLGFGGAALLGDDARIPIWVSLACAAGGVVALLPGTVNGLVRLTGKGTAPFVLRARTEALLLVPMVAAWGCYAGSLFALRPSVGPSTWGLVVAAYAIAYVAGVLVFLAPAGVGAREAMFVLVAGHTLGVGNAAALALLTRVVMTVGDVLLAAGSYAVDRRIASPGSDKATLD
jgi:uncharacterized membrane protein YbhN (UPF0104 family)